MTPAVTVRGLLEARPESVGLSIELLAGSGGLHRKITSPYIQKTGLALAGFHEYLQAGRILLFGESEVRFLESLDPAARRQALAKCFNAELPCLLLTGGADIAPEILLEGDRAGVPILRTSVPTAAAIGKLTAVLEDRLAHREIIHGVLIDILGLGVLIVGDSGIGKSECALDLVVRGHRLVADDTVEVRRRSESIVIGACPEMTRHHMEVRGLGLINIRDLFGVAATRTSKRIELVVQLDRWDEGREYDRLGLDEAVLRAARAEGAADPHAGRAGTQPGDPRRGCRAQSAAADARHQRRARAGRAARCKPRAVAELHAGRANEADDELEPEGWREQAAACLSEARRMSRRVDGSTRAGRASSSSPACPARASRRRFARSRISATTASTTCRCRCCR